MVFTFGPLIEHISKTITLRPGDVIASGTPAGVGFGKKPRRYAKPGSVVEVNVHGVDPLHDDDARILTELPFENAIALFDSINLGGAALEEDIDKAADI